MSDVAQKVWIRGRAAYFSASAARATSCSAVRQSAATFTCRHWAAMALTAAKSPSEAIGKPASMMSTPRSWSLLAIRTFSVRFIEQPGDCSPSRKVVSKMLTRLCGMGCPPVGKQARMLRRLGPRVKAIIFIELLKLFCRDLSDAAGVLLELAGVVETCEIFLQFGATNPCADLAENLLLQPIAMIVSLPDR